MFSALGSLAGVGLEVAKIVFRMGMVIVMVFAFTAFLVFTISLVGVTMNGGVLSDLIGLVQMWLPFNLSPILAWLIMGATLWITYRLSVIAVNTMNKLIGNS